MKLPFAIILGAMAITPAARAIVGGAAPAPETIARSVVTIVGSRGNFCTGSVIAPGLVLTVAHCVQPGTDYKIVLYGPDKTPQLQDVKNVAIHPGFRMEAMLAHRATADVALLRLDTPAKGKAPALLGAPQSPIAVGAKFIIAGVGVTVRGDGKSAGTIRSAALVAAGRPGSLQIRLVDPATMGAREGLCACTGDSGSPVFEDQPNGATIIGLVSWSTGSNGSSGCGGISGVTPLTLYRDWILQTARQWGINL